MSQYGIRRSIVFVSPSRSRLGFFVLHTLDVYYELLVYKEAWQEIRTEGLTEQDGAP